MTSPILPLNNGPTSTSNPPSLVPTVSNHTSSRGEDTLHNNSKSSSNDDMVSSGVRRSMRTAATVTGGGTLVLGTPAKPSQQQQQQSVTIDESKTKRSLTATKAQLLTSPTPPLKPSSDRSPQTSHAPSNNQRPVRTKTAPMPFGTSTPAYIKTPNTAQTRRTTPNMKKTVDKTPRNSPRSATPSQPNQTLTISPLVLAKVPLQANDSNKTHNKTASLTVVTNIPLDQHSTFIVRLFAMIHHSHRVSPDVCRWVQNGTAIEVHSKHHGIGALLAKFFQHSRFLSLQRQLNNYCFLQQKPDSALPKCKRLSATGKVVYCHPLFRSESDPDKLSDTIRYQGGKSPSPPTPKKTSPKRTELSQSLTALHGKCSSATSKESTKPQTKPSILARQNSKTTCRSTRNTASANLTQETNEKKRSRPNDPKMASKHLKVVKSTKNAKLSAKSAPPISKEKALPIAFEDPAIVASAAAITRYSRQQLAMTTSLSDKTTRQTDACSTPLSAQVEGLNPSTPHFSVSRYDSFILTMESPTSSSSSPVKYMPPYAPKRKRWEELSPPLHPASPATRTTYISTPVNRKSLGVLMTLPFPTPLNNQRNPEPRRSCAAGKESDSLSTPEHLALLSSILETPPSSGQRSSRSSSVMTSPDGFRVLFDAAQKVEKSPIEKFPRNYSSWFDTSMPPPAVRPKHQQTCKSINLKKDSAVAEQEDSPIMSMVSMDLHSFRRAMDALQHSAGGIL